MGYNKWHQDLYKLVDVIQARRQEGFEGIRSNPLLTSKRFYTHRVTVNFKCPTV